MNFSADLEHGITKKSSGPSLKRTFLYEIFDQTETMMNENFLFSLILEK